MTVRVFRLPSDRAALEKFMSAGQPMDAAFLAKVTRIVEQVREGGDAAVYKCTKEFDGVELRRTGARISEATLRGAWNSLPAQLKAALRLARRRIIAFHERQKRTSWTLRDSVGLRLTQRWLPLQRVGVYVPGGRAAYPSTVLMNVVPAQVAGVDEIVAVTPPAREGIYNAATLGALHLCGVKEVYSIGGAQAVAALAHGTETIRRVDKIVGPGNAWVAGAKRLLYGTVDIDSIAGPSEVMILADETASPDWIAADMLAQAEHDEEAQAVAVLVGKGGSASRVAQVQAALKEQVAAAPRRDILQKSIPGRGAIVLVANAEAAIAFANEKAPEHLEVAMRAPARVAALVRNAGSIFVGLHTPEPLGDYLAGPNHVLPTGGTARFASALSVDDFMRMTQLIEADARSLHELADSIVTLAEAEGLQAHADAVKIRFAAGGAPKRRKSRGPRIKPL